MPRARLGGSSGGQVNRAGSVELLHRGEGNGRRTGKKKEAEQEENTGDPRVQAGAAAGTDAALAAVVGIAGWVRDLCRYAMAMLYLPALA